MDQLVKALETDVEWIRKHTEFGGRAHGWMPPAGTERVAVAPTHP
jgi:hypothetical protein